MCHLIYSIKYRITGYFNVNLTFGEPTFILVSLIVCKVCREIKVKENKILDSMLLSTVFIDF